VGPPSRSGNFIDDGDWHGAWTIVGGEDAPADEAHAKGSEEFRRHILAGPRRDACRGAALRCIDKDIPSLDRHRRLTRPIPEQCGSRTPCSDHLRMGGELDGIEYLIDQQARLGRIVV
jgi:hypothetical protein